jgi:hypothetical protein
VVVAESRIVGEDGYLQAQIGPRQPTGSTGNKSGKKVITGQQQVICGEITRGWSRQDLMTYHDSHATPDTCPQVSDRVLNHINPHPKTSSCEIGNAIAVSINWHYEEQSLPSVLPAKP